MQASPFALPLSTITLSGAKLKTAEPDSWKNLKFGSFEFLYHMESTTQAA